MTCNKCGSPLEMVEQIRIKPVWSGGGRETIQVPAPCSACERRQQEQTDSIMRDREFRRLLRESRIPQDVWEMGLNSELWAQRRLSIDSGNEAALEALRGWVEADNAGCLLTGTQGLGKSLLALCAGVDCLRRGQEVLWVTERDLLDSFRGRRDADRDLAMESRSVEVLVLDDIGRHQIDRGGKYMMEVYLDLFDCRLPVFGPPLKTLLTSQHDAASLAKACCDDALASRLLAIIGGNILHLTGTDRRRPKWRIGKGVQNG